MAVKEVVRKIGGRVFTLEQEYINRNPVGQPAPLVRPRIEYELKKKRRRCPTMWRNCTRFKGNSGSMYTGPTGPMLNDFEIVIGKPLYRSIVLHIRDRIRSEADLALWVYRVPDGDRSEIKRVLALHYIQPLSFPTSSSLLDFRYVHGPVSRSHTHAPFGWAKPSPSRHRSAAETIRAVLAIVYCMT